jgi:hypothetical protein
LSEQPLGFPVGFAFGLAFGFLGMIKRGKADKQRARKERLSAALRENLKRRKRQARDRAAASVSMPDEDVPGEVPARSRIGSGFCHNRSDE